MMYNFSEFSIISIFVFLIFAIVLVLLIIAIVKAVSQNVKNNNSPILTVDAVLVTKHISVSYHNHCNAGDISGAHGCHVTTFNNYYVTFQVESGDRMIFSVDANEYGMIAEGDIGRLTFQGTRFLNFQRL